MLGKLMVVSVSYQFPPIETHLIHGGVVELVLCQIYEQRPLETHPQSRDRVCSSCPDEGIVSERREEVGAALINTNLNNNLIVHMFQWHIERVVIAQDTGRIIEIVLATQSGAREVL